ncbi:Lipid carrier : UDP-N-acetylgalactosaminyltransferase [Methylophaga frappieri]|uniref:Lipid carrier: UDP-N-acetylgalactosaminyltransferase n=1 Tax=Methylophaga frappieri (strain ATCC BAA-2434 / DSM 25690 / JAM7) TaxID=754477 RepID=I1YG55_METFJ|nr:sugar transferase [Methylophaga frappieri]AFJ01898.1 Lipid carrier : UDP-N-acetylgalactosaminyltransferase [Methylophaga frappieri]
MNHPAIRILDFFLALFGLIASLPVLLVLMVIGFFDTGSPIFRQQRVGRFQQPFTLLKFRTMRVDTEQVATHLADRNAITRFGHFLRRSKLDELPQLWNVLKGEMSLVGPRPCLYSQIVLIEERVKRGVFNVRPGITGLAQINSVDMSEPERLAEMDAAMIQQWHWQDYFRFIIATLLGKGKGDRVRH